MNVQLIIAKAQDLFCEDDKGWDQYLNDRTHDGSTSLLLAFKSGDILLLEELLNFKANPHLENEAGENIQQLSKGKSEEIQKLIDQACKEWN